MIAWEIALAGLAFGLIGALLALRFAEALSEDGAGTALEVSGETAGPSPSHEPSRSGSIPDEDRVLELLSENDGRLRQQAIVDRTGWSKSKASRLLSKMEERGTIRKVPIGRENAIELVDREGTKRPVADGDDG